jgi:hypothetical protein
MTEQLENIIDNGEAIQSNLRTLRTIMRSPQGWSGADPDEKVRLLMELRHDLEDALKSVKALESEALHA